MSNQQPNTSQPEHRQPHYRLWATLLDGYDWYLSSEKDEAYQEFLDKLNRVPMPTSPEAAQGIAFQALIDSFHHPEQYERRPEWSKDGFTFNGDVVDEFVQKFYYAHPNIYTEAVIDTRLGEVKLYGYADAILADSAYDIKFTGRYSKGKFLNNWQHRIYPYCLNKQGIYVSRFEYTITDGESVWIEDYVWMPDIFIPEVRHQCEELIHFIESQRDKITNPKLFPNEQQG